MFASACALQWGGSPSDLEEPLSLALPVGKFFFFIFVYFCRTVFSSVRRKASRSDDETGGEDRPRVPNSRRLASRFI